jgi:hypothetical protein
MTADAIMRACTIAGLIGVAALSLFWRNFFGEVAEYFTRAAGRLSWMEKVRLQRVIEARQEVETVPAAYTRAFAGIALGLAALEFFPAVPFIVPFATMSVALAFGMLGVYLLFSRRWKPRVAPLVRRSVFTALPAPVLGAISGSFVITVGLALTSGCRSEGIAIALTVLVMAIVAWRIAIAPTLLLGVDPEWEYAVDERLRTGRARVIVVLGCLIAGLFASVAAPTCAAGHAAWVPVAANGCTLVAVFENARVQWQEVHPA